MPASSSTPPLRYGWTITGAADPLGRRATSASVRRSSATPPDSVLCAPARRSSRRRASRARPPPRLPRRRLGAPLRHEREPVGLEQRARLRRRRASRRRVARALATNACASVDAVEVGTDAAGRRSQAARCAASPSARAADSGYANAASPRAQPAGRLALTTTAQHRLSVAADDPRDRARDVVRVGDHRQDEEHDHRVDAGVGKQRSAAPLRRSRRWRSRACRPGSRRSPRPGSIARARRASRRASSRQLRPAAVAGVRAEDPEPAGVRQHRDAVPARQRLRREQHGGVDQLLERRARG